MGEHLLHAFMNFEERAKWDKTYMDFKLYPGLQGNELVHMKLHAPPCSDRDLVSFHTVARHQDGHILIYSRQADDAFLPRNGYVRGRTLLSATLIEDLDGGGVRFTSTNIVDRNLICKPPERLMNVFVPKEMKSWVQSLEAQCAKLKSANISPESLPCAKLLRLRGKSVPVGCCMAQTIDEPPKSLSVLGNNSLESAIECATNLASSLRTASTPSVASCEGDLADDLDDQWPEDDLQWPQDDLPEVTKVMISLDNSHSLSIFGCLLCNSTPCTTAFEEVVLENAG